MNNDQKEDIEAIRNLALKVIRLKLEYTILPAEIMTTKKDTFNDGSRVTNLTAEEYRILFSEIFKNKEE